MRKKNEKKDNNLVLMHIGKKDYYYSSMSRAGAKIGLQAASILWAIHHRNELVNNEGEIVTVELIDGSEIPYKLINN